MKKGKTSKLSIFDNAKCVYGTVDSINFKSFNFGNKDKNNNYFHVSKINIFQYREIALNVEFFSILAG